MRAYFALSGAICTKMVLWLLGGNTSDLVGNYNQSGCLTLCGCLMEDKPTIDLGFLRKNKISYLIILFNKVNRCWLGNMSDFLV